MKRREFVEKIGMGSAGLAAATAMGTVVSAAPAAKRGQHDHSPLDGPLASAIVSFGQWRTDTAPPHDRFPNVSDRFKNQHGVIPYNVKIKVGGSVTFNISGTHLILVYAPGTTLASINGSLINDIVVGPPPFPGFVNDPVNRVYRGLDPRLQPQDRTETITFAAPGTYLVVCGVVPHFVEGMHGFVKVVA